MKCHENSSFDKHAIHIITAKLDESIVHFNSKESVGFLSFYYHIIGVSKYSLLIPCLISPYLGCSHMNFPLVQRIKDK
jgi:hypothetical protein